MKKLLGELEYTPKYINLHRDGEEVAYAFLYELKYFYIWINRDSNIRWINSYMFDGKECLPYKVSLSANIKCIGG